MLRLSLFGLLALGLLAAPVAGAQEAGLTLRVRKNFGYNAGRTIQGSFTLEATGPADLAEVTFWLDGEALATDAEPPFKVGFGTGSYTPGRHTLRATGQTAGGLAVESEAAEYTFITAADVNRNVVSVLVPIGVVVALALALGLAVPLLAGRGGQASKVPLGAPRSYGFAGGAICHYCARPYARHFWAPNIVVGKLDRCDNCGQWQISMRASPQALEAAEAAERRQARAEQQAGRGTVPDLSPEEKLRRQIDESRYSE